MVPLIIAGACASLVIAAVPAAAVTARAATTDTTSAGLPAVYPTPQQIQALPGSVTLPATVDEVIGTQTDGPALSEVNAVLQAAGVTHIVTTTAGQAIPQAAVTVYVGGPSENSASAAVLTSLNTTGPAGLPSGGYVLAVGQDQGHDVIVASGVDGTGTFYAAQTLRQLVQGNSVHDVLVRDWPSMPLRGIVEGFYGPEYSNADRVSMFDFMARNKMNIYVYSPKDDPYLRAQWQDPYPAAQLSAIQSLVQAASADHVTFTYALSPGLSICYSSSSDEQTLVAKLDSIYAIGVRSFSIPFDDITEGSFNCAADTTMFGSGNAASADAQAYLLNEVQTDFIATHPGVQPLQTVPTEYTGEADSAYKTALRTNLDPAIVVGWTGDQVISPTITATQAAEAQQVYGHPVLLWDNYPVNDYITNRLLLGPYVGRDPGLAADLTGVTANPMIQSEPSKISLFGTADYSWNPQAYNAHKAWIAGINQLAGPNPQAQAALRALADLSYSSDLNSATAPELTAKINNFWWAWERGLPGAAEDLGAYLKLIQSIPTVLAATLPDPDFITQAQPQLDAAGTWGTVALEALKMLTDERSGQVAAAIADRIALESSVNSAPTDLLDSGILASFVSQAQAENGRFLGVPASDEQTATGITSFPSPWYSGTPQDMVDGSGNYFWSGAAPGTGDYIGVDLGNVLSLTSVTIAQTDSVSPDDYIQNAALQYSSDGVTWTTVATYTNQPDISATFPAGATGRYVRLVATAPDVYWVKAYEFNVEAQYPVSGTVSGGPAPAAGSSLANAADTLLNTSYTAASSPAPGDALTLTLPAVQALDKIEVVGTGEADVQVQVGGDWRTIGKLSSDGYTELPAFGATAGAIRLAWVPGSPPPVITDIIPRYSADESLAVTGSAPDIDWGGSAQLSAQVTSTQTGPAAGLLTATAPAGLGVTPSQTLIPVLRGGQTPVTFTLTPTAAGTFPVTLTYTPLGGTAVTTTVDVTVHPQVSTTNVALAANGGVATASGSELNLPQFAAQYAIDGDLSTRWSSPYDDAAWWQVQFASPQNLGEIQILWGAGAAGQDYNIETSTDGINWTVAASITNGNLYTNGSTETIWINQSNVNYVRFQGIKRDTQYGYSFWEFQVYPVISS